MRSLVLGVSIAFPAIAVMWVETAGQTKKPVIESSSAITPAAAIEKGARWLASVQGADGGFRLRPLMLRDDAGERWADDRD